MIRNSLMLFVLVVLMAASPARSQSHDDFCYFSMMLDNTGPLPHDLESAPAALLISVIDYTNVYIPVIWEERLVKRFLNTGRNLDIDLQVASSGIALNKAEGDKELAALLRSKGVKNVFIYTVVYQRTPARIKTGHTITVAPFTGDASIVDMAGDGHSYVGKSLAEALNSFAKEYGPRGDINVPQMHNLSNKVRVTEAVKGLPNLMDAELYMHGYFEACVPPHPPKQEDWLNHYKGLEISNERVQTSRDQLDDLLHKYDLTLKFPFLTQDLGQTMGDNDYIIVPIDDRRESIQTTFIPIKGQKFMEKVPHDMENPYYIFGLFHPKSGKLYVPEVESRGYGNYFDSLEDIIRAINAAR